MRHFILAVKKTFWSRRFLYYSIFGTVATLNVAIFSKLLSFIFHGVFASVLGYWIANVISYFLNSYFTFKDKTSFYGYLRYAITYVPNYIIYQFGSVITLSVFHWDPFFGTVVAAIAGVPITFVMLKVFAFNSKFKR